MLKILFAIVAVMLVGSFVVLEQRSETEAESSMTETEATASEEVVQNDVAVPRSRVLDLSGQGLTKAPVYIFAETATQELDLSNNQLEGSLQAEVRFLQNLQILNLSHNQFTGVPAEIGQLKNLEVLDLSNNSLTGLPQELGNLSNLKLLNLRGNNYAVADLDSIKQSLPATTEVLVD